MNDTMTIQMTQARRFGITKTFEGSLQSADQEIVSHF